MIGEMKNPLKYLLEIYQRHVAPQGFRATLENDVNVIGTLYTPFTPEPENPLGL
jgi:hypothetical protein